MLIDAILDSAGRYSSKVAVDDGRTPLTYGRLIRLSRVLCRYLRSATRNERVGILLPASAIFPATLFGVLWARKVAVPLNFLLAPDELAPVVEDAGLDLILTIEHFRNLSDKLRCPFVFVETLPLKRWMLMEMVRRAPRPPQVRENDTAVILYTSGTTSRPKGVELSYRNLHSNTTDTIRALNLDAAHRFLNILPPFHVFGLTGGVLIPTIRGLTVHALPRFSPVGVVKAVEAHQITVMMAIPSMYAAILKSKSATKEAFRSVELAISGGEPLSESVRAGFEERFGVVLRQGYGLTETSPVVSLCTTDVYKQGTVGRPIPNVEVRIVGSDSRVALAACPPVFESLPTGQEGEIFVRGPGVMKGYYHHPEETAKVIDANGWFRTGDIGRIDEKGFLSITGRAKDMLIIGGENVFAREIESVLEMHEAVLQAAVIGMPDELRGEQAVAFVIPRQGAEANDSELRAFVKNHLAGFKVPKRIEIRPDLPTGPTGKILKRKLRELL